jgi:hypothetical protein
MLALMYGTMGDFTTTLSEGIYQEIDPLLVGRATYYPLPREDHLQEIYPFGLVGRTYYPP